jgi:competence protein ComEA
MRSRLTSNRVLGSALVTTIAFRASLVVAMQVQLPEGPGKAETVKVCSVCHQVERATAVRLTRDGWDSVIGDMVQRGAKATDEERRLVLDYLSTHFLGEAARPLNLNRATQIDLEIVAGLLRKEAATLVAHLKKTGPCKSLESLKEVKGIDYKKIEERKDYLVCQPLLLPKNK